MWVGKIWLFDFCEALAWCVGQKAMCQMCDGFTFLSFEGRQKTKSFVFQVSHFFYFLIRYQIFCHCQVCSFLFSHTLWLTAEAICSKGLRATFLSTDTKFYAGQNA